MYFVPWTEATTSVTGWVWACVSSASRSSSRYRANGLGQADDLLTPHALYLGLDKDAQERQSVYRALFRPALEQEALADIRLALDQGQPLGNGRFLDQVERMVGRRCEVRPRGRPRKIETLVCPADQLALSI